MSLSKTNGRQFSVVCTITDHLLLLLFIITIEKVSSYFHLKLKIIYKDDMYKCFIMYALQKTDVNFDNSK